MKNEDYRRIIGGRVQDIRESRHWSQADLARYVGCGQSTISKMEDGKAPLDHDIMCAIAEALGVSVLVFLPGADKPDLAAALYALHPDITSETVTQIVRTAEAICFLESNRRSSSAQKETFAASGTPGTERAR
jgi:transcriptional regulator with XRE-family HTH domain